MVLAYVLTLRIIGVFAIMISSFIGVVLPTIVHKAELHRINRNAGREEARCRAMGIPRSHSHAVALGHAALRAKFIVRMLKSVGVGVVWTTGILHVMPEASVEMEHVLHNKTDYPITGLIVALTVALLYVFEREMEAFAHRREAANRKKEAAALDGAPTGVPGAEMALVEDSQPIGAFASSTDPADHLEDNRESAETKVVGKTAGVLITPGVVSPPSDTTATAAAIASNNQQLAVLKKVSMDPAASSASHMVMTHVLQVGLALHSIVIGLTLGLMTETGAVRVLVIALCFDQGSDGVAIGASIVETGLGLCHTLTMMLSFSMMAPAGIVIGIFIEQFASASYAVKVAQATLSSISAGILLHMSLVDMLPTLLDPLVVPPPKSLCRQEEAVAAAENAVPAEASANVPEAPAPFSSRVGEAQEGPQEHPLTVQQRILVYSGFAAGVTLMAIIGKWG